MLTPYEDVPSLRLLLGMIATVPVIDVIVAAAFTWAAHSSVAVVLLIMSFAAQGVVPPQAAIALVLGANLGTALNPLFEAGSTGDPAAKRLPIGNLLNRAIGCVLGLALLGVIGPRLISRAERVPSCCRFPYPLQPYDGGAVLPECSDHWHVY